MATSNLEALNELIQKIKAGERRAKSNLEALNLLCVIAGGTGAARSNLEALNELLTVFSPGGETQEKAVTITANGTTEIIPDEGYTLSKATVNVNVSSGGSEYNVLAPAIDNSNINTGSSLYENITSVNLNGIKVAQLVAYHLLYNLKRLVNITWGDFWEQFSAANGINTGGMFYGCSSLNNIDLTFLKGRKLSDVASMFGQCSVLTSVDLSGVNIDASTIAYMFTECTSLEYINLSGLAVNKSYSTGRAFYKCTSLKNLVLPAGVFSFDSTITIDLSYSPLTHDCAVDIFNKLADRTGYATTGTLTLSPTTKGYLTDAEIAIATGKGWVIA